MKAPEPSEIWPQYPTRMFTPSAASARIRNGIRMARNMYSSASIGTPMKAKAISASTAQRS